MLRIVPPTVTRVGRSDEHFPDGFELHLLPADQQEHLKVKTSREKPELPQGRWTIHLDYSLCRAASPGEAIRAEEVRHVVRGQGRRLRLCRLMPSRLYM